MCAAFALATGLVPTLASHDNPSLNSLPSEVRGIVFTRLRAGSPQGWEGAQIVIKSRDGAIFVLPGFHSAADPEVSFDATRMLFSGKRSATDKWQVFEADLATHAVRQLTREAVDCRHPIYQSKLFTLDSPQPWYQTLFVRGKDLYSIRLDGSELQRLTFNLAKNGDPVLMPDGRIVFASAAGPQKPGWFGINLDGTDYALFAPRGGRTPALTEHELIFVEATGRLAAISLRRPAKSYRVVAEGKYASPAPLSGDRILVSTAAQAGSGYRVQTLDVRTGARTDLVVERGASAVQARAITPRPEPDGRSSVVEKANWGKLYCLSAFTSGAGLSTSGARHVRVFTPEKSLGDVELDADGSFNIEVPPDTPLRLELLTANGAVAGKTPWIWARQKENRGCIGCHEDPELVPENAVAAALTKASVKLTTEMPARVPVFASEIQPLLMRTCANGTCHTAAQIEERLAMPGRAGLMTRILEGHPPAGTMMRRAGKVVKFTAEEQRLLSDWVRAGAAIKKESERHASVADDSRGRGGARSRPHSTAADIH